MIKQDVCANFPLKSNKSIEKIVLDKPF